MNEDEKIQLKTMLNYLIDHNEEHSQEFREWAEKAKTSGESEVCDQILQAADDLDRANEALNRALQKL